MATKSPEKSREPRDAVVLAWYRRALVPVLSRFRGRIGRKAWCNNAGPGVCGQDTGTVGSARRLRAVGGDRLPSTPTVMHRANPPKLYYN